MNNNSRLIRDICSSYNWVESYSIDDTLRTVLSHNDEPTSIQATSVASSKEHIDLALGCITDDIDNLENALDLLRTRQYDLKRLSVKHAGALSKRRQLPNEILSEIFLHACCDDRVRVGGRGWRNKGPWRLREVCRKWASIVEGCCQLWSKMFVDVTFDDVDPAVFAQVLQFCGSRHINMKLELFETSGRINDSLHTLLDTITSCSSRWETLEIESHGQLFHIIQELFPRLEQKLPALRSLKLQGGQYDRDLSSPTRLSALLTAPLLENVHMDLSAPEIVPELLDILPIPCQQIRRLLCHSYKYEPDAWHVPLSLCKENFPRLECCMITSFDRGYAPTSNPISASDRIEHDGVVQFTTSQGDMLDVFSFPSLRTLFIGKSDKEEPEVPFFEDTTSGMVFKRASRMLRASQCSLVSLVLPYSFTLVDEFLQVLDVVPTLELLDMSVGWSPEGTARDDVLCKLFTALGSRTSTTTFSLLPALRDLRLSIAAPYCIFTASGIRSYGWSKPRQRCNLRFLSQALDTMTERSKCPSNFRGFSFALISARPSPWRLLNSELDQLRAHRMIRFSTNTELHSVESFESVDDKDDESSLPASSPPRLPLPESDDETFDDPLYL